MDYKHGAIMINSPNYYLIFKINDLDFMCIDGGNGSMFIRVGINVVVLDMNINLFIETQSTQISDFKRVNICYRYSLLV